MSEQWTEVSIGDKGIGVTLYDEDEHGVFIVDEWWATQAEIEAHRNNEKDNIVLGE